MVFSFMQKEFKLLLKEKGSFFWLLIMPLLFIVVFGSAFGNIGNDSSDMVSQVVPGYTVMFVFFVIINMLRRFISDKESGMIARLRSTSMSPLTYLLGMWIPYFIAVLIQCTILLVFGHFVYGVDLGDVGAIAAIVIVLALCGTSIGLALSMCVNSQNQGIAFTQLIALGGAMLGGLWFPIDMLPKAMQVIAHFTPQYWAQQSMLHVMIRHMHLSDIWPTLGMLVLFAALGLTVALLRFKRFVNTAMN